MTHSIITGSLLYTQLWKCSICTEESNFWLFKTHIEHQCNTWKSWKNCRYKKIGQIDLLGFQPVPQTASPWNQISSITLVMISYKHKMHIDFNLVSLIQGDKMEYILILWLMVTGSFCAVGLLIKASWTCFLRRDYPEAKASLWLVTFSCQNNLCSNSFIGIAFIDEDKTPKSWDCYWETIM